MNINESQILETWSPLLESELGISDPYKMSWISKYCHYHALNESANFSMLGMPPAGNIAGFMGNVYTPGSIGGVYGDSGSGDKFPMLLPMALQVAKRTIGFDLVNVIPMQNPAGTLVYLDYVYGGGREDTFSKPSIFKTILGGSESSWFNKGATYATIGTTYRITNGSNFIDVKFVGNSGYDGDPIFRVISNLETAPVLTDLIGGTISIGGTALNITINQISLVKALEDHIEGFAGAGATDSIDWYGPWNEADQGLPDGMKRGVGENTYFRNMGLRTYTKWIEAKTVQVACSVTIEQIQDLNKQYGYDVIGLVQNSLINELSQSNNKQILARLFALGWFNNYRMNKSEGVTLNSSLNPAGYVNNKNGYGPDGHIYNIPVNEFTSYANSGGVSNENEMTIHRRLLTKILAASNIVLQRGRRGQGNFIVTNLQLATVLQNNAQFSLAPVSNTISQDNGSLYPLGSLAGLNIYVDPNMDFSDTRICVGRKGKDEDPGLKYMPYLIAETFETISEASMSPKVAVKSRYAITEAGHFPESQYYTFYVDTNNISIV